MIIDSIIVNNFRSLKHVNITFDNLTVCVGRNGSGKSSLLHAISLLFTPKTNITLEDFFARDTDKPIETTIIFKHFTIKNIVSFLLRF
jgi:predicted ATP-dependent endonuclease of OLD family